MCPSAPTHVPPHRPEIIEDRAFNWLSLVAQYEYESMDGASATFDPRTDPTLVTLFPPGNAGAKRSLRILSRLGGKPRSETSSSFMCSEFGAVDGGECEVVSSYQLMDDGSVTVIPCPQYPLFIPRSLSIYSF